MKKGFRSDTNSVFIITCDNLGEYFSEFTKYRKSLGESEDDKSLKKIMYSERSRGFWEDDQNNRIVDFLHKDYDNVFKGRNGRLELALPLDLESPEWKSCSEKVSQTLKEIWKSGEMKNPYNLDLNWPQPSRQPDQPADKKVLTPALTTLKYQKSPAAAQKILAAHIGLNKEKEWFADQVYLYSATQGNFIPTREIICYVGPPGTGKTTFVYRLSQATTRPCQTVACAGQKEFNDFSILGSKDKPSLAAWAIKASGCRNPLILLDELEKVSDHQIQKDLIQLFDLYQQKGKLFDPYFQTEIDLSQITFFATVNYADELAPLLKNKLLVRRLEKFTPQEKKQILTAKSRQMEKEWGAAEGEIIPAEIIFELAQFPEEGVRQSEAVLSEILKEWIIWKAELTNQGKKFSLGNPQKWLAKKGPVVPASFRMQPKYYPLFILWFIIWVLVAILIAKKFILENNR